MEGKLIASINWRTWPFSTVHCYPAVLLNKKHSLLNCLFIQQRIIIMARVTQY